MPKPRSPHSIFEKATVEIGRVTMFWAGLEHAVDELIIILAHIQNEDIGYSIVGNADIRGKIQMAKALAFIRKDDDDWLSFTLNTLDCVDNDLRVRRNQVVHSRWFTPNKRGLARRIRKTRLKRPQSFQMTLSTQEEVPVKLAELRTLVRELWHTTLDFTLIIGWIAPPQPDPAWPSISFRQFVHLVKRGPPKRARSKPCFRMG